MISLRERAAVGRRECCHVFRHEETRLYQSRLGVSLGGQKLSQSLIPRTKRDGLRRMS